MTAKYYLVTYRFTSGTTAQALCDHLPEWNVVEPVQDGSGRYGEMVAAEPIVDIHAFQHEKLFSSPRERWGF